MQNPGTATPERFPAQDRFADGAQFIAGRLTKGTSGRTHAVVDPSTGEEVYTYELAGVDDVDPAAFRRYGSARNLYTFKVDNAAAY